MYNILMIEKLLLYSFVCLFVLNNAKSVTGDTDLSFTYDLIELIVNKKLKDLAGELKTDIKRIDDRCAGIEQDITDLKAANVEATLVENNEVTAGTLSKSANQQMDKLSLVIYRTLSEEKNFIRNTIVGLEDRINEFEKSVTDNYQLLANNVNDISRQVTINAEQNNMNSVYVNQLNCSMEEAHKDSIRKTREIEKNILRLQTYIGSGFKTIQADICIIPVDIEDNITLQTVHDGTHLVASSEVSSDTEILIECGETDDKPANITIGCNRGQWVDLQSWENRTKEGFPKCLEIYPCLQNPCIHGTCMPENNKYTCMCDDGYTGSICETEINPCLQSPCIHGTCMPENNKYTCMCDDGYTGSICETVMPTDCYDIKNLTNTDGVYTIKPTGWKATMVYCDMTTTGGGWTVFQNRYDGSVDFYRNFSDYENGFGDLNKEFWLGLKIIRRLVENTRSELRLDMTAADDTHAYEVYPNFSIDASPSYTLHIDPGHGTAGDVHGLSYNNNNQFATYDRDNSKDCAEKDRGGWWYDYCAYVNLNGHYETPGTKSSYNNGEGGVTYRDFKGPDSLKTTKLMFRRS